MGPRTELASLLLEHEGFPTDDLDRFTLEDRAAMLYFLTRYRYLIKARTHGGSEACSAVEGDDRYAITQRGRELLKEIARERSSPPG